MDSTALKLTTIILLLFPFILNANANNYGSIYINEITSIYDADTFRVNIKDWPEVIGKRIPVRVLGIDTPEIRGKCEAEKIAAREAKQFTVSKLRSGKVIELRDIQRGKYFRLLANVFVDGKSLSVDLIKHGHARIYNGGKRLGWCN